jgi:hypothetical protein
MYRTRPALALLLLLVPAALVAQRPVERLFYYTDSHDA